MNGCSYPTETLLISHNPSILTKYNERCLQPPTERPWEPDNADFPVTSSFISLPRSEQSNFSNASSYGFFDSSSSRDSEEQILLENEKTRVKTTTISIKRPRDDHKLVDNRQTKSAPKTTEAIARARLFTVNQEVTPTQHDITSESLSDTNTTTTQVYG